VRQTLTVWIRGARLLGHVIAGVTAATAVRLDPSGRLHPQPVARWWSRKLLRILNLKLQIRGSALNGPRVTVANHVSWLDIPLLAAGGDYRFIAKSEIRSWPVAGWLADAAGTFYIRRGKGGARPLLERLVPHLISGGSVVLFPEGTTTAGDDVLPFHARLFAAAVESGTDVQPVTLRYLPSADGRAVAPFIGDDDLLSHILRLLRESELRAELIYGESIASTTVERDELARIARQQIQQSLQRPAPERPAQAQSPTRLAA
jgi:1-acyl-sn-glycerol-3-phosphate acyltransferase